MTSFLTQVQGFTPLIEVMVKEVGIIQAAVYGVVWRYCQRRNGVCTASHDTLAEALGLSRGTVQRHIKELCKAGYLKDTTPDRRNRPHVYADTGRAQIVGMVSAKVTVQEKYSTVSENDTQVYQKSTRGDCDSIQDTSASAVDNSETQPSETEQLCADCKKPFVTSKQTPRRKDLCVCKAEQALTAAMGERTHKPTMPMTQHYTERMHDPWVGLSDGRFKHRDNASVEAQEHVLYLVRQHTGKWPTDGKWKHWNAECAAIYQAGGGDWGIIEQGIKTAWGREPKYRPKNIAGFQDEVDNARATAEQERKKSNGKPKPYTDAWYDQQMANNPQLGAFDGQ